MDTNRKPAKPLIELHEIETRVACLRRRAARTSSGPERDGVEAEIGLLEKLYAMKLAIEAGLTRNE